MQWDDKYKLGVDFIDEQHETMFHRLDILLDRSQGNRVQETLNFLGDYVVKHFSDEEMLMKCCSYPWKDMHQTIHKEFVGQYLKLRSDYEKNGEELLTLMRLTEAIQKWLVEHIMGYDKAFVDWFKLKGDHNVCQLPAAGTQSPSGTS